MTGYRPRHIQQIAVCTCMIAALYACDSSVQPAAAQSDLGVDLVLRVPAEATGVVEVTAMATHAAGVSASGAYETRLIEPDREVITLSRRDYQRSSNLGESRDTDVATLLELYPGPFTARVVFVAADREILLAERTAWMGPPDAPVLVLESLSTDTPAATVGQPVTATVTVTNRGRTSGSRRFPIWLWTDEANYTGVAEASFVDVRPDETRSVDVIFTHTQPVMATRLEAGDLQLANRGRAVGPAVEPFSVLEAS